MTTLPPSSRQFPLPMTLKQAADRRAELLKSMEEISAEQLERAKRTKKQFAEARACLPPELRDILLPVKSDGSPVDTCLFHRDDLSKISDVERDARFRYRLAFKALEWRLGLARAVNLLPPNRDGLESYIADREFDVTMALHYKVEEIESVYFGEAPVDYETAPVVTPSATQVPGVAKE